MIDAKVMAPDGRNMFGKDDTFLLKTEIGR